MLGDLKCFVVLFFFVQELFAKPPSEMESDASSSTSCQLIGTEQADSLSKPPESELVIEIEPETKELEEQEPDSISPPPEVKVQEFEEPEVNLDSAAEVTPEILPAESDKTEVLKKAVNGFELKYSYREGRLRNVDKLVKSILYHSEVFHGIIQIPNTVKQQMPASVPLLCYIAPVCQYEHIKESKKYFKTDNGYKTSTSS